MPTVIIRRQGCMLEVDPAVDSFLGPHLTYVHKEMKKSRRLRGRLGYEFKRVPLYSVRDHRLYCGRGFFYRVKRLLESHNFNVQVEDMRRGEFPVAEFSNIKIMRDLIGGNFELRPTQKEMLAKIDISDMGIFEVPTAAGKTTLLKLITLIYPTARIIFATPEQALARDLHHDLARLIGHGDVGGVYTGCNDSMSGKRILVVCSFSLEKCPLDKVNMFFFDEVHRSAAPVFSQALSAVGGLNKCKIFGLSATPEGRSDQAEMVIESFFGPIIHTSDYSEEVSYGSIVPLKVYVANCMYGPGTLPRNAPTEVNRVAIWRNQYRNKLIFRATEWAKKKFGEDVQQLILVDKVEHGLILGTLLPDFEVTYASCKPELVSKLKVEGLLDGGYELKPKSYHIQLRQDFCAGRVRRVIATNYHTGLDAPNLKVAILASGETSRISIIQKAGRTSRTTPDGQKDCGILVDFKDTFHTSLKNRYIRRNKEYLGKKWEVLDLDNEFMEHGV